MDAFDLLSRARLTQVRFSQISAHRASVGNSAGSLLFNTTASVVSHKTDANKALAKISLDARGIPKDAAENTNEFAFRAELEIRGIYRLPDGVTSEMLKRTDVTNLLCQPLYVLAMRKTESVLADLGVTGLQFDCDLRTIADGSSAESLIRKTAVDSKKPNRKQPKTPTKRQSRKTSD